MMTSKYDIVFDQNPHGVFYAGQTITGRVEIDLAEVKTVSGVYLHFKGYSEVNFTEDVGTEKMMTSKYDIVFDQNSHGVFFAGQTITGRVEMDLAKVKTVTGVYLHFKGYSEVSWTDKQGIGEDRRMIHYTGHEDYIDIRTYLVGSSHGERFELSAGNHSFPFSYSLPYTIATSIEGKWGFVRYTAKVGLERPWKYDNTYVQPFTVLRHLDFNEINPDIYRPITVKETKVSCCGPCSSDSMFIVAEIPISGYVPGQTVAIKYDVYNHSHDSIEYFEAKLVRTDIYKCEYPRTKEKYVHSEVATVRTGGARSLQNVTIEQFLRIQNVIIEQFLKIPSLPPTTLTSNLISITYAISINVEVSGWGTNPQIYMPITIGTVPLSNTAVPGYCSAPNVTNEAPVVDQPRPSASEIPSAPLLIPEELPPPSYEEAIHAIPVNLQDEGQVPGIGWNPKYMVYQFGDAGASGSGTNHPTRQIDFPMPKQ
ncbi:arrestin domain-containing protein 3-like isoform X2 [Uranotaenia lowii]|uniref:arrestin domain-containing protein 3-like isoform X2 n=1 Tax=Uranotaenia lowii TaxID=190385 RepID=UPI00247A6959|nr:arrestin domain-containing protein 3-like isoform X2 [Uranotaenia lowii]